MVNFLEPIIREWRVIEQAPYALVLFTILIFLLVWAAMHWRYGGTIATLRERLAHRDDKIAEYGAKLEGASPDEAKEKIENLEARLAALEAVLKLGWRGGWPGSDVIPNGYRSQFGDSHVDPDHPPAA